MKQIAMVVFMTALCVTCAVHAGTITDDSGHEITLARPARRIVSLAPVFSEIVVGMKAEKRLVAKTDGDKTVRGLPSVGSRKHPGIDRIAAMKPDLVLLLEDGQETGSQAAALRRRGIKVARFQVGSFHELFSCIERLGDLMECGKEARELTEGLNGRLDRVTARIEGKDRPVVFYEISYPKFKAAGDTSMTADIIRKAGGRFMLEGSSDKVLGVSEETLLFKNPDIYLVQQGEGKQQVKAEDVASRQYFNEIKAVRRGKVFVVDERLYSWPGLHSVEAVEALAETIETWQSGVSKLTE